MPADWRAGTTVTSPLPVVRALEGAGWYRPPSFRQPGFGRWDVVEHPVDPDSLRRLRVRRIRVVHDQRERLDRRWHSVPNERRGGVLSVAGVFGGDQPARAERGGGNGQLHDNLQLRLMSVAKYVHCRSELPVRYRRRDWPP